MTDVFSDWNHHQSLLAVLATGLGKTVIAAEISLRWPESWGKILFVAHREELIDQARDKIGLHTGDVPEVEMGKRYASLDTGIVSNSRVVVASVQTLSKKKRRRRFNPMDFGLVIIDEAHHATAASYLTVLEHFKQNPACRVLGITATPKRHDKVGMKTVFEKCSYEKDIREGIDEGWLVPVQQKFVIVENLDFTICRKSAGDFNLKDLNEVMMGGPEIVRDHPLTDEEEEQLKKQEAMVHKIVDPTVKEANGRPTLVFCVTKEHANKTAEIFRRHEGVTAEVVIDSTPTDVRKEITERFRKGLVQVLVGVGCFTEGFDAPNTAVVAVARPTQSEALYKQMIGRGTRPLAGTVDGTDSAIERKAAIETSEKPFVTVLDFVGASGRHSIVSTFDVLAGENLPDDVQAAIAEARRSGGTVDVDAAIKRAREAREDEERKEAERQKRLDEARKRRQQEAMDRMLREEEERRKALVGRTDYRTRDVPIDGYRGAPVQHQTAYRGGATDAQVEKLVALGCRKETAMGFKQQQAREVIKNMTASAVKRLRASYAKAGTINVSTDYVVLAQGQRK